MIAAICLVVIILIYWDIQCIGEKLDDLQEELEEIQENQRKIVE